MKNIFHLFIPLFLLDLSLNGCRLLDSSESRLWLYSSSSGLQGPVDSLLTPASFLELRPDGSYTQDFGRFDYGHWSLKNGKLYLTNQKNTTYVFRLKTLEEEKLDVVMGRGEIAHFTGMTSPFSAPEKDPFSLYNNQWRIPATHKEADTVIRKRLFNHCGFWEAYFTWAVDKKITTIDVRQMPTPLKIYQNGFGLKRYDDLPAEWKSYFFDDEDCHKADSLIKRTFRRNKIVWPDANDDYIKFISGFQQLEKFLR